MEGIDMVSLEYMIELMEEMLLMQPAEYELGELAHIAGVNRDTLRKHLITHYRDGEHYHQKTKHGKIYIARPVALEIRRHYGAAK